MNLFEVIDRDQYEWCVENKYIKVQQHPTDPLLIHNYTDSCTWEKMWNQSTITCRGLITDINGEIVSRSFPKFFNYEELQEIFEMNDRVTALDKMDGSLGILYKKQDDTFAIATRGSFTSEQAIWATYFFNKRYPNFQHEENIAFLFEIIYPQNKIVVDYNGEERLVFLGAVENDSGRYIRPNEFHQFHDVVKIFPFQTYAEIIHSKPRENAEGYVFFHHRTNQLVKFKFEEYKRLHKMISGVTEKNIWEMMMLGEPIDDIFKVAPDEFHKWVIDVSSGIKESFDKEKKKIMDEYQKIRLSSSEFDIKKNFAIAISNHSDKSALFALYNNKSINEYVWKKIKPKNKECQYE